MLLLSSQVQLSFVFNETGTQNLEARDATLWVTNVRVQLLPHSTSVILICAKPTL